MKIEITRISNGLLLDVKVDLSPGDPLGQGSMMTNEFRRRFMNGPIYSHDGTDLMGHVAELIQQIYGFTEGEKK